MTYTVFLEGRFGRWGTPMLYQVMARNPPEGFRYVLPTKKGRGVYFRYLNRLLSVKGGLAADFTNYVRPLIYVGAESILCNTKKSKGNLTFCAQHLNSRKEPWVVDLEFVTALTAYGRVSTSKKILEKAFSSKYCKAILPYSKMSERSLYSNLDCSNFKEKIEMIPLAIEAKKNVYRSSSDKVRILFLGTANPYNVPYSFEHKGGLYVLEAWRLLSKKFDDIELIVRSHIPPDVRERLLELENVKLFELPISQSELKNLFISSDIFLHPTFETVNPSVFEAMSYGVPVIAFDVYDYPDTIRNDYTGILVSKPPHIQFYREPHVPNNYTKQFLQSIRKLDKKRLDDLVKKTGLLIEDTSLRRKLSANAKREIASGTFSITNRNLKLRAVFEKALSQ